MVAMDDAAVGAHSEYVIVPDLRGLLVDAAEGVGHDAGVIVTSSDTDGPSLGALTWPGRWVVTSQSPEAGKRVRRWDTVVVQFEGDSGGNAGVREPRRPPPDPRAMAAERGLDTLGKS